MLIGTEKLNSKQSCYPLEYIYVFTPTSQKYFIELFKTDCFDLKQISLLPGFVILDNYPLSTQYKILKNILHLDGKKLSFENRLTLCPFLKRYGETVLHMGRTGFILRK